MNKFAQYSIEYIMIIAFSALLLIPTIYLVRTQYNESKIGVQNSQIEEIGREIANQAEIVFYQGIPAQTIVEASFPDDLKSITSTNKSIKFELSSSEIGVTIHSNVLIYVDLENFPGRRKILIKASGPDLEVSKYHVNITDI